MERIVIVGCSGSGKSTLARELGQRLGLPVTHLDALYWEPGWRPTSNRPAFDARVLEVVASDRWIIDGGYSTTLPERLGRADTAILMMFPLWQCLWRVLARVVKFRGMSRPDMASGCAERVDWEFLSYIWNYRRRTLPRLEQAFAEHFSGKPLRLDRQRQVDTFLQTVGCPAVSR